jgi:UTP-glucose-1-phosphate uridylyltransferase
MLALTGGAPKELLRVGGESALARVARECAASGVTELLVVIAPGKREIIEHLSPMAGAPGMPLRIAFVEQPEPRGLADAIRLGRDFAAGGPLGVALPDNLFVGDRPALAQVVDRFVDAGRNVVAVVEISAAEAGRRGPTSVLEGHLVGGGYEITRIPDKREGAACFDTLGAASAFTAVGRFVLDADAFHAIDEVERELPLGAELDDLPVMQRLLRNGRLTGRWVRGRFLDLGLPDGFREADELLAGP